MQLRYPIGKGSSLSHWRYSGIEEKPVDSPAQSFYAPVNLGEAYVQIIYPVRKHFLASHKLADVQLYDGPYAHAWFPFEDSKVNFSTARPTPTFMWTNLSSIVKVPETGSYPFAIATCGAIKLWIDGREAVSYAPYDRNIPHTKEFQLELTAGEIRVDLKSVQEAGKGVFCSIPVDLGGQTEKLRRSDKVYIWAEE